LVWAIIILSVLFMLAGAPLAYVVGASSVLGFVAAEKIRYLAVLPKRVFSQIDVFALISF